MIKPLAVTVALCASIAMPAWSKLPPPTDAAKAAAAEAADKSAWSDKIAAFKLCIAMDRTAEAYRQSLKAAGKEPPAPSATPSCADPGPYSPITTMAQKPLEASEAHSPPGTAHSPPSTKATAAEIQGGKK